MPEQFFVGWDVGAWNCDQNANSRDALVILNSNNQLVGQPWGWANLRKAISDAETTEQWIQAMFELCQAPLPNHSDHVTLAIDTPLGFSDEFHELVLNHTKFPTPMEGSRDNRFLYRATERFLFERGHRPMSSLLHQIGSQTTKGIHVLSKFAANPITCGVWQDPEGRLSAIEAYPSACKDSPLVQALRQQRSFEKPDMDDALTCAIVAFLLGTDREQLAWPPKGTSLREGWIWVPVDGLSSKP